MSTTTTTTTETAGEHPSEVAPWRLRLVLAVISIACVLAFRHGNAHTEEFRLTFPLFHPWLWNLYLSCAPITLVGAAGLWWRRRWGFWTLIAAAILASVIGIYAMGFTLIGTGVVVALAAVWFAVQPDWKSFR